MIFNMSNIGSETRHITFTLLNTVTTNSYTISDVETPTGSIRGFILVRTGSAALVDDSIYFAFAFPNVDSSGNFRYLQYANVSGIGPFINVRDTASLTGQGYVYDSSAKTLTLNVYSNSKFPAGDYELLIW